jgi:hypothetical protein
VQLPAGFDEALEPPDEEMLQREEPHMNFDPEEMLDRITTEVLRIVRAQMKNDSMVQ